MRGSAGRIAILCASTALVAACSTSPAPEPELSSVSLPSGNGVYKIGEPYEQEGVWYYPREQPEYDETGIASWYGADFHGRRTANGEVFDLNGLTAAHPTLPMPVNVRVTNLENGKSLVLRVNDRGPFRRGRIIDVSQRAAQLLGFYGQGTAKVRVTYLARADGPPGTPADTTTETAVATAGTAVGAAPTAAVQVAALDPVSTHPAMAAAAPAAPAADPAAPESPSFDAPSPSPEKIDAKLAANADATPVVATLPVPAATHIFIQLGAFSIKENAERLKDKFSAAGNLTISPIDRKGRILYKVRVGPFDDVRAADSALAQITGLGSNDAKIVVDQ
ncbi:MAG TPA: septal ring lytic transglycosylase RlpA family protein [Rhizomicrobium sp.]|jgi:rare lipoprotein A|nr:septal ring lytic transglycosylase RlpA family protein [Rhizomicrobium sp.]